MKKLLYLLPIVMSLAGCIRVNLLPADTVRNSINAGKNIYDEAKLKSQGASKRDYVKQVLLAEHNNLEGAENFCLKALRGKLHDESPHKEPVIVSERVGIVGEVSDGLVECQVVGFVWPKVTE